MKNLFITLSVLLSCASSFAQSNLNWAPLTTKVIAQGEPTETFAGIFMTVRNIQNLAENSYHARYYSAVGGYDDAGKFNAGHLELVSEKWTLSKDNIWNIDQWLFSLSLEGELHFVRHYKMQQTLDGTVLGHDNQTIKPGEDLQQLKGLHQHWQKNL